MKTEATVMVCASSVWTSLNFISIVSTDIDTLVVLLFLYMMSHDVKTSVPKIATWGEMLHSSKLYARHLGMAFLLICNFSVVNMHLCQTN